MGVSFLSPVGFLVALAGALPLAGLALVERRGARLRRTLRLGEPDRRARLELAGAFGAVAVLLGLAAAQPVLALSRERAVRGDAEVLFVIDVSRSMEASSGAAGPTRLARAKAVAVRVRAALGDVPAGVASMTDRTLPYLFPTANVNAFDATVEQSVAIESPPPAAGVGAAGGRVTTLGALVSVATTSFYSPGTTRRVLIVLSDDESEPVEQADIGTAFRRRKLHPIFIRFWNRGERIYGAQGRVDPLYRPDPTSARTVETLAVATGGRSFGESSTGAIVRAARAELGRGAARRHRLERTRTPIAAWLALAAVLPLGLILRRRNL